MRVNKVAEQLDSIVEIQYRNSISEFIWVTMFSGRCCNYLDGIGCQFTFSIFTQNGKICFPFTA